MKLADYLFARLKQFNVDAIHGVPGDYNLTLLDFVEPAGLLWVGNANELNAGYAADGYARTKGMGAIITTFGVGELSAINAIAGAFTERAAVVHIVGTPPRNSQEKRLMIHHTLGDGDYTHFAKMAAHVTAAQTNLLNARTAAQQIDQTLRECIVQSRPVYIEVPVDMVSVEVGPLLPFKIDELPTTTIDFSAKNPVILVDGEIRSLGIIDEVQSFIDQTQWPTWTSQFSKGLVHGPNIYGIYRGSFDSETKKYIDNADLVVHFGPHPSSTNSYNWTTIPDPAKTISFSHEGISVRGTMLRDVSIKSFQITNPVKVDLPNLPRDQSITGISGDIKQDQVWKVMSQFLRPGDVVMAETGTAAYGGREMVFPKHTRFFTAVTWLSIGYMLPACQGAALAQRELIKSERYPTPSGRTILIVGDGSFQMTAQEISTIIKHNLNVVIFLINNDGYTIERCIHGVNQGYNDVSFWRYLKAPDFFGAPENTFTASARTYEDLEKFLKDPKLTDGEGLRMVEVFMDKNDAPAGPLLDMMTKQALKK